MEGYNVIQRNEEDKKVLAQAVIYSWDAFSELVGIK